jgi:hypothetical protein
MRQILKIKQYKLIDNRRGKLVSCIYLKMDNNQFAIDNLRNIPPPKMDQT